MESLANPVVDVMAGSNCPKKDLLEAAIHKVSNTTSCCTVKM